MAVNKLRAGRPDIASMTDQELHERTRMLWDDYFPRLFSQHISITGLATLPVGIITAVCEAVGRPEVTLRLMSGLGDVESAAPANAMWNLSRTARKSASLTAIFENGLVGLEGRIKASDSADTARFGDAFADFLYAYGARGPMSGKSAAQPGRTILPLLWPPSTGCA